MMLEPNEESFLKSHYVTKCLSKKFVKSHVDRNYERFYDNFVSLAVCWNVEVKTQIFLAKLCNWNVLTFTYLGIRTSNHILIFLQ